MRNIEGLIQYLIPFSFLAIWAITSLMNRDPKPVPARRPMADRPTGPRPGEPTLRWGAPNAPIDRSRGRMSVGREDDILIISPDDAPTLRQPRTRPGQQGGTRRTARVKPGSSGTSQMEGPASQPLVSGVNQGVNQQLATTIDLQPLATTDRSIASVASRPNAPSAKAPDLVSVSKLAAMMVDPARLREAFLMNELLKPPVSLRPRGGRSA